MNRSRLFYGGLALYGLVFAADGGLTLGADGATIATVASVVGGLTVMGAGLYGLARPAERAGAADSWLAYLVAVGAVLATVGLVLGRL